MTDLPEPVLLRRAEVESLVGMKRAQLYRKIAAGEFPRPVSIGGRSVRWRRADLDRWLADLPETAPEPEAVTARRLGRANPPDSA